MKIDHIAMYVNDLEQVKCFFIKYFSAVSNELYHNSKTGLKTYFLTFSQGSRLEIMTRPNVTHTHSDSDSTRGLNTPAGYHHLAFSLGSETAVDHLTNQLREDGFKVLSGPRTTGDGYYESAIEGPEGNILELSV